MRINNIERVPADNSNYTTTASRTVGALVVHHMASHLTAEQCGRIFQTPNRGASAHYGIGYDGEVAQYVDDKNIAWAVGNWEANCSTISIECSNSETGGNWPVSDATIDSLIKLLADLAEAHDIKKLVVGETLTYHKMYSATQCPGEYLMSKLQYIADEANKLLGNEETSSPETTPQPEKKDLNALADEVIAGQWGNGEDRFNRLREAGYDPEAVQAIVNNKLGQGEDASDLKAVAEEVIAGLWGNGDERVKSLTGAGYNYDEVQAVVNAMLGYTPQKAPKQAGPASIPLKVGDVATPVEWKDYNGTHITKTRSFYYVSEITGDRAVLRADSMTGPIFAAVKINNLRKA